MYEPVFEEIGYGLIPVKARLIRTSRSTRVLRVVGAQIPFITTCYRSFFFYFDVITFSLFITQSILLFTLYKPAAVSTNDQPILFPTWCVYNTL